MLRHNTEGPRVKEVHEERLYRPRRTLVMRFHSKFQPNYILIDHKRDSPGHRPLDSKPLGRLIETQISNVYLVEATYSLSNLFTLITSGG